MFPIQAYVAHFDQVGPASQFRYFCMVEHVGCVFASFGGQTTHVQLVHQTSLPLLDILLLLLVGNLLVFTQEQQRHAH